ncbi:hypothetical protein OVX87_17925 [Klebsiella pneumoniae]|nr:hypothetical protein [Klebsiella pneumoniae]
MNISTVNELIASLGSAGELSIREQKFLKLAKAYQQLAAENVQIKAMNDCLSEELRGYESDGAFEGPKMHLLWWQVETPPPIASWPGLRLMAALKVRTLWLTECWLPGMPVSSKTPPKTQQISLA